MPVWGDKGKGWLHTHARPPGGPCSFSPVPLHNPTQVLEPFPWGQLHTLGPTPSSECLDVRMLPNLQVLLLCFALENISTLYVI